VPRKTSKKHLGLTIPDDVAAELEALVASVQPEVGAVSQNAFVIFLIKQEAKRRKVRKKR
jgi:hypothetical protein